ncbi:hypothetical protein QBC45DRAFT_388270 [Copromyces sp. CBS 386.78]|nr:hypothetical protein QBC45DRAFT_388270 [Copromyces sp. CBS 386.78]
MVSRRWERSVSPVASRKRAPSPGFLADAHGNVFKRCKAGNTSFYFTADALESPTNAPGSVSDAPSGDTRIPLWREETRTFKGTIMYPRKANGEAQRLARIAQSAALWVDGKPHFNLFVDGSHKKQEEDSNETDKKRKRKRDREYRTWGPGGYGVVFRNPYHKQGPAELDHNHNGESSKHPLHEDEDGLRPEDFNIRCWSSDRVLSQRHAVLAVVSQGLETVAEVVKRHRPPATSLRIFTDSIFSLNQLTPRSNKEGGNMRDALTLPLVRAIVWQSHFLADLGCEIKLQYLPNKSIDKPLEQRDGILDKVHEDIVKAVNQIEAQKQAPKSKRTKKGKHKSAGSNVLKETLTSSFPFLAWDSRLVRLNELWESLRKDASSNHQEEGTSSHQEQP